MATNYLILAEFSASGWTNGLLIGGAIGAAVGLIYKFCFGNPGRQAP